MAVNRGKDFETVIKAAFEKVEGLSIDRLHDQTTGFLGSCNICDFIVYREPNEIYIECKSCHGNTFPISNITDNQYRGLVEKSKIPGVIAGVIVWWVDRDITAFFDIAYIAKLKSDDMKSIKFDTAEENGFIINGKKKRVFFDYDMKTFLDEVQEWIG